MKLLTKTLLNRFRADRLPFKLKVGDKVQLSGKADVYKPSGRFSFIVEQIVPTGEGLLKKAYEKLKNDLQKRGYFQQNRKRALPEYPKKIAVLTSKHGDAIKDFQTHLGKFGFKVTHLDCRVEGIRAIKEISAGIKYINTHLIDTEVIVLTRGGGSLESLQAYNSLEVAEAIYSSKIPVLTAVGHENDVTIADLVADARASTQTAAGQLLSHNWQEAKQKIKTLSNQLDSKVEMQFANINNKLEDFWDFFCQLTSQLIDSHLQTLKQINRNLYFYLQAKEKDYQHVEELFQNNFKKVSEQLIREFETIYLMNSSLNRNFKRLYLESSRRLNLYEKHLLASDPKIKLKQGYSIIRKEQKIINNIDSLQVNDEVNIQFYKGRAKTIINNLLKE
jgi:exodeoxyribonuclease VII large subunit